MVVDYDVIAVGGGLAGSALAKVLAEAGLRVLVLEREVNFRDRVRGEQMHPWGIAEAKRLGLYEPLMATCANEVRYWSGQIVGYSEPFRRDLFETTAHRAGSLNFYHPKMQAVVIALAEKAGATVLRGVQVVELLSGSSPGVRIQPAQDGKSEYRGRLVVGADGRNSLCRRWGSFQVERDPPGMTIAGVRLEGMAAPRDAMSGFINPQFGTLSLTVPQKEGFRVYVGRHRRDGELQQSLWEGKGSLDEFVAFSMAAGTPKGWFEGDLQATGPLASFESADNWVPHPHSNGVVLIGDAAASNDPCFGCGLSLTLRDVRVLADHLLASDDWATAAEAYATEHDDHYGKIHRMTSWFRHMYWNQSEEAKELRQRAIPRLLADRTRGLDITGTGPELPADEAQRQRFFCED
jgi:2-polyprenyl-6-methoxyphenol hydroxylase-like FAD-dependent oxidoreductase